MRVREGASRRYPEFGDTGLSLFPVHLRNRPARPCRDGRSSDGWGSHP